MKVTYTALMLLTAFSFGSCIARKGQSDGGGSNSNVKSVTINQPDLKSQFIGTLSEDDKKKVLDGLVYSVGINPVQKDSKDDCNAGSTASKFDSGINAMDKSTFDTIKVKRGCNYIVSMKIGQKSDDGKSIKTLLLSTWDDKQPSVLSKDELEKAKPSAAARLFVTADGKKYWNADEIVTSTDTDTSIDATLSKTYKLKIENLKADTVTGNAGGNIPQSMVSGSLDMTPLQAVEANVYCGVAVRALIHNDTNGPDVYAFLNTQDAATSGSVVTFSAGGMTKVSANMVGSFIIMPGNSTITSRSVLVYCASDADVAKAKLQKCSAASDPKTPTIAGDCTVY